MNDPGSAMLTPPRSPGGARDEPGYWIFPDLGDMLPRLDALEKSIPIRVQRKAMTKEVSSQLSLERNGNARLENQLSNQVRHVRVKVKKVRNQKEKMKELVINFDENSADHCKQTGSEDDTFRNIVRMVQKIVKKSGSNLPRSKPVFGSVGSPPAASSTLKGNRLISKPSFPFSEIPRASGAPDFLNDRFQTSQRQRKLPRKPCPQCGKLMIEKYVPTHIKTHCKRTVRPGNNLSAGSRIRSTK